MTCKELVERLYDFLHGELDEEMIRHLEQHLSQCPPCVTYVKTYQITIHLSRRLPAHPLPAGTAQRLLAMLKDVDEK